MSWESHEHADSGKGISTFTWALIGFLAVSAYFLFSEHRAHFIGFLPWLLLLACPFLHFLHGGHGHGGHGDQDGPGKRPGPGDPS